MKLLIDIGNTRLKWVFVSDLLAPLPASTAISHAGQPARALEALAAKLEAVDQIWIAQVMGEAFEAELSACAKHYFDVLPHYARSQAQLGGLRSAYAQPQRLGVDRFLSMLAVQQQQAGAFCVASAGTALTFDAVNAHGQHLGGVIAPGLQAMATATLANTRFFTGEMQSQLPDALGKNTEDAVQLGALYACIGLLEHLAAQNGGACVLSGGDALKLHPMLTQNWQLAHDLVLQGLACYAALEN